MVNGAMWWKKLARSRTAVIMVVVLLGMSLSGCNMSGILTAEAAHAAETKSETETESEMETEAAGNDETGTQAGTDQDSIRLEYNSGGDTPTITTVIFHLNTGVVEVNALASSMYELIYESAYKVEDNNLTIDMVSAITATDISGVAKVIGLPETMDGNVIHTVSEKDGAVMLTIQFGDPENLDEAAVLCEIELTEDVLAKINEAAENVTELLHMEFASEKEDEDSSQTTADIRFFSNGTCILTGCINSLYQWEYNTRWEFDNILMIKDPDILKLSAVEGTEEFLERLGLEPTYEIGVQNKISLEEDQLLVAINGVPGEDTDLLRHVLTEDIHPLENDPEGEATLLENKSDVEIELLPMAEFALAETDAQCLGFSLDDIKMVSVEGISFKEDKLTMMAGETKTLEVVFKPEDATNKNLKWTSENPGIASVDAKGTITGKATGQTKVTATSEDGDFKAVCTVEVITITPPVKPQASVSGEVLFTVYSGDSSITFYGNGQCAVNATHNEYADGVAWPFYASYTTRYDFSGSQLVISGASASVVDGIGILPNIPMSMSHSVTMTGGGATISISASGKGFGTYSLSAAQVEQLKEIAGLVEKPAEIAVEEVVLSETALTLEPGATATLTATITPQDATNTKVLWSSSDESIATVLDGNVQAVAEGTAVITATSEDGGKTASCTVTVAKQGEQDPGVSGDADITLNYDDGKGDLATKTTAAFYLSKNTVKVDALASGMYQLGYETTYSINNNQLTFATASGVTAKDISGVAALLGLPAEMTGDVTHTVTGSGDAMKLTIMFGDTNIGEFILTTETQKALGLSVEAGGETPGESDEPTTVAVEAVSLNADTLTLEPGTEGTLTASIAPQNATNQKVTWTSSNEGVATVSDGKVLAVSEGSAIITVTTEDGKKTATCTVTVAKNGGQEDPDHVTLDYDDGKGDTATKTSVGFDLSGKKVSVNALVSGMYQLDYEAAFSVTDDQLTIATATGVTATDITGIAALLGLPSTLKGDVTHLIKQDGENLILTVTFSAESLEEDSLLGEFKLTPDDQKKLGLKSETGGDDKPDEELKGDITLTYDDGKGETATKTTAAFFLSNNTLKVKALASGMYQLTYETTYAVNENQLSITTATGVTASDITGIAALIGLPPTMTGDVTHTVTKDADQLKLTMMFGDTKIGEFTLNMDDQTKLGITPEAEAVALDSELENASVVEPQNVQPIESESNSDADSESAPAVESESNSDAESESAPAVEPESNSDAESESAPAVEFESNSDAESESAPAAESESVSADKADGVAAAPETVSVTGITLEKTELTMEVDDKVKLKVKITPTEATNQKINWKSSDENIVKIKDDELIAVGEGTVTITATTEDGDKVAKCKITVKAKDEPASSDQNDAAKDASAEPATEAGNTPADQSSEAAQKENTNSPQADVKQPEATAVEETKPETASPAGANDQPEPETSDENAPA